MSKNCDKKKIVVGIIGLGVGAFHLKNSLRYKNCKVKYICDKNKKKLNFYKKNFKIEKASKNSDDIINDKEINVVIIASNDNDHFNQTRKSLLKNKNVFVEKPLCLTRNELNAIINIKKKKT